MSEELDQVIMENTSLSVEESVVILQETPPSVGRQEVSTEIIPPENEQQVLLTESEIKKEPESEDDSDLNDYKPITNLELDTKPVPWSYSILRLLETEESENLNELPHYVPKRYSVRKTKRRCLSVPRYMKLLTEPKNAIGDVTIFDTDSESDNDGDSFNKSKTNLKRKRGSLVLESIIKTAAKQ